MWERGRELGSLKVSVWERGRRREGKQCQVLVVLISFELLFGLLTLMSFSGQKSIAVSHTYLHLWLHICSCVSSCICICICSCVSLGRSTLVLPLITRCPNKFETKTVIMLGFSGSGHMQKGTYPQLCSDSQRRGRERKGRQCCLLHLDMSVIISSNRNTSTDDATHTHTHKRLKIKILAHTHTHTHVERTLEAFKTWNTSERGQMQKNSNWARQRAPARVFNRVQNASTHKHKQTIAHCFSLTHSTLGTHTLPLRRVAATPIRWRRVRKHLKREERERKRSESNANELVKHWAKTTIEQYMSFQYNYEYKNV